MKIEIQKLANKSLEIENDFSSTSHAISTITYESSQEEYEEFSIPSRYYTNTLTLLAINTQNYYVYWEVTQAMLEAFCFDLRFQQLHFQVESKDSNVLFEFESPFDLGEYFFELDLPDTDIYVKMGIIKENQFIEMLQSNTVHTFSTAIKLPDLSTEVWLEKYKNYAKIIQTQLETMLYNESSSSYVKQLERLHYLNNAVEKRVSSTCMLGKKI
jgi:uncharacterized protein